MDAKRNLTPLSGANLLDDERLDRLAKLGVTTVEELVGLLQSDPDKVREVLGLEDVQFDRLKADAPASLPEATRDALSSMSSEEYYYGAVNPDAVNEDETA